MLAAVFHGPSNIAVQEVPVPLVTSNKILLKVNACGVCSYDARVFRNGHRKVSPPVILGHELCGEIQSDVMADGMTIKAGSRVALCPLVPCLVCAYCQNGQYNLCMKLMEIGSTVNGGFAQYVTIPEQIIKIGGLVPVPDELGDEEAALLEPLACSLNSFSILAPNKETQPVVIIGDGPMALIHLQLYKNIARTRVAIVGRIPLRIEKARSMGADAVFSYDDSSIERTARDVADFTGRTGAGVAVIATSNPAALEFATRIIGKNSKINIFAGMSTGQMFQLDANWLHYNQISITGSFSSTPEMLQQAARIAAERLVDLSKIVTHQYPLQEIQKAMMTTEGYHGLRAVINKFI
ncbi:MAG TPA: alcohol dehydrogenase catalytic domain-containing protein [Nitrososphaera sp.]|nr:alcohol dehydrogenase catalytic domain-containing protein [Nitrososphaera sp.]